MAPAAARSASACTRRMFSSTHTKPASGVGVLAFAARARAGAREQGAPRGGRRRDSWRRRRARAGRRRRPRARTPPPARARFRRRAPATAARIRRDRTGRPRRSAGQRAAVTSRRAGVGRRPHARDGERPAGRLGARALPLDAPLELGVRQRLRPRRRPRRPIRLHHEHQRADRDRLAGQHAHPRPRRQLAVVDARAVRAAQVFDLDVVVLALADVQPQVAAGCFGVIQLHVDGGRRRRARQSPRRGRAGRTSRTASVP